MWGSPGYLSLFSLIGLGGNLFAESHRLRGLTMGHEARDLAGILVVGKAKKRGVTVCRCKDTSRNIKSIKNLVHSHCLLKL